MIERRFEISVAVAQRDASLTNRHAAIGFAFGSAIDGNEPVGRPFDLDHAVHQHFAAAVHGDEICRSIALAGDNNDTAVLQRDIGNQRVSDNDGRDPRGELDELRLIDVYRNGIGEGRAEALAGGSTAAMVSELNKETTRRRAHRRLNDILYSRGARQKGCAAKPPSDSGQTGFNS